MCKELSENLKKSTKIIKELSKTMQQIKKSYTKAKRNKNSPEKALIRGLNIGLPNKKTYDSSNINSTTSPDNTNLKFKLKD